MSKDTCTITLPAKWQQKAKDELGEDEKEVDGAIGTLRSWAEQEPWLSTPTDSAFLLRYLRVRKFSQLEARKTICNFWTHRTKLSEWFNPNVHPDNPAILDLIKSGFYVIVPGEDSEGRRLLIERIGYLNLAQIEKKYGSVNVVIQALLCILDTIQMDERVQVNGMHVFVDCSTASLDTAKLANPSVYRRMLYLVEKGFPQRIKGVNVYGIPSLFEPLVPLVKSLITQKFQGRFRLHSKMVTVYDHIEKKMLPQEYLPDDYEGPTVGTLQDVIDYTVKECTKPEVVAHIKDLNSGKYGVDLKLKETTETPAESFRKLNIS